MLLHKIKKYVSTGGLKTLEYAKNALFNVMNVPAKKIAFHVKLDFTYKMANAWWSHNL